MNRMVQLYSILSISPRSNDFFNSFRLLCQLFSEGIRYSTKSEAERIKYGLKLEKELVKFQQHFLPHMQEEEDIFQPLLVQYFSVEELKELKESVLKVREKSQALKWFCSHGRLTSFIVMNA